MEERLQTALIEAMNREFEHIPEADELHHPYAFSDHFQKEMGRISKTAERNYVSVGRHRLRRAVVAALIAAMILAAAVGAAAIRRPIVQWLTRDNQKEGALDVTFQVDDPDGLGSQFTCIKPKVPKGYEVVHEEETEGFQYLVILRNAEGQEISYLQTGDMEGMALGLDNETGDLQETEVNGYKAYAYSSGDSSSLIWSNGMYLFDLGGTCSMETLREIAEKIN